MEHSHISVLSFVLQCSFELEAHGVSCPPEVSTQHILLDHILTNIFFIWVLSWYLSPSILEHWRLKQNMEMLCSPLHCLQLYRLSPAPVNSTSSPCLESILCLKSKCHLHTPMPVIFHLEDRLAGYRPRANPDTVWLCKSSFIGLSVATFTLQSQSWIVAAWTDHMIP